MGKPAQGTDKKTTWPYPPSGAGAVTAEFYVNIFWCVVVGVLIVDENLYRERFLLWAIVCGKGEWMMYTPDLNRYPEALVEGATQAVFVLLPNNQWIAASEFLKGGLDWKWTSAWPRCIEEGEAAF